MKRVSMALCAALVAGAAILTAPPSASAEPQPVDPSALAAQGRAMFEQVLRYSRLNPMRMDFQSASNQDAPDLQPGRPALYYSDPSTAWSVIEQDFYSRVVGPTPKGGRPKCFEEYTGGTLMKCRTDPIKSGTTKASVDITGLWRFARSFGVLIANDRILSSTVEKSGKTVTLRRTELRDAASRNLGYATEIRDYTWVIGPKYFSYTFSSTTDGRNPPRNPIINVVTFTWSPTAKQAVVLPR